MQNNLSPNHEPRRWQGQGLAGVLTDCCDLGEAGGWTGADTGDG